MEKERLITILSQKEKWFDDNGESVTARSGDVVIADVTSDSDSFQKYLKSIDVQIESVDKKAAVISKLKPDYFSHS